MSAVGNTIAPPDPVQLLTSGTVFLTIPSGITLATAVFNGGLIRAIRCNQAGAIYVRRVDDAAVVGPYTVVAGEYLYGKFFSIGGTSAGTTVTDVICEY